MEIDDVVKDIESEYGSPLITAGALSKFIMVDDIAAASYISREQNAGRPFNITKGYPPTGYFKKCNLYSIREVLLRTEEHGLEVIYLHNAYKVVNAKEATLNSIRLDILEVERQIRESSKKLLKLNTVKELNKRLCRLDHSFASKTQIINESVNVEQGNLCGIYFLIDSDNDDIVYVGQSTNVWARVRSHQSNGIPFDKFTFISCDLKYLNVLESLYIHTFTPFYNSNAPMSRQCIVEHLFNGKDYELDQIKSFTNNRG